MNRLDQNSRAYREGSFGVLQIHIPNTEAFGVSLVQIEKIAGIFVDSMKEVTL